MNLLAFALHTFLELTDADYQLIRTTVGARRPSLKNCNAAHNLSGFAMSNVQDLSVRQNARFYAGFKNEMFQRLSFGQLSPLD